MRRTHLHTYNDVDHDNEAQTRRVVVDRATMVFGGPFVGGRRCRVYDGNGSVFTFIQQIRWPMPHAQAYFMGLAVVPSLSVTVIFLYEQ